MRLPAGTKTDVTYSPSGRIANTFRTDLRKTSKKSDVLIGEKRFHVYVARNFVSRLKGLLDRKSLSDNEGLLITKCSSIHMIGMRFPIDVIWLSADGRVMRIDQNVPAGFHFRSCIRARHALEVAAGATDSLLSKEQLIFLNRNKEER